MKIAVIGAGLSGLALAYHLTLSGMCQVDLFDEKGIGGAASGIACGLMHPYVGEEAKRSWMATEALEESHVLLASVSGALIHKPGILRIARHEEERQALRIAFANQDDVEEVEGSFLIKSGVTVNVPGYLQGLWNICAQKGAKLHLQNIQNLEELKEYDQIVVAAGANLLTFPECQSLKVQFTKGQLLICRYPQTLKPLERSLIGKGYVALSESADLCVLGSTYERGVTSALPDLARAKEEILPKIASFFPDVKFLEIESCKAGIRVARKGHYLPIIRKIEERKWVCTAMGSRGLLYHALAGKMLASALLANDESKIIPQFL